MAKFSPGQRVLCTVGDVNKARRGEIYLVAMVGANYVTLVGHGAYRYDPRRFEAVLLPQPTSKEPLAVQVGGDHYKDMAIQPVEYIIKNNIPFVEGNVIKYVSRWRKKNGVQDLEKAKHLLDILIQNEKAKV